MKHVIIGAGPAGVVAAETLRKLQPNASVILMGDEHEPPYSRMAIPYYLSGNIGEAGTYLRKSPEHFTDLDIELLSNQVTAIDSQAHILHLRDNPGTLDYDKLLLATGAHAISPPIPGIDLPGITNCWTIKDAVGMLDNIKSGTDVVLMGAGFIGCIILEALASLKVNLTVIEMADRMVPRMMDQRSGNLIKKWCESKGVTVHTSTKVESIEQANGMLSLHLDNGKQILAQHIISATGVSSNIDFLQGSELKTDQGVLVNNRMQTSDPDIYAAGDVCQGKDFSTNEYSVQAIQPTAVDHGRIAAMNMMGRETIHQGSVNLNVLDTLGLISSSYGLWMGVDGGDSSELYDEQRYRYIKLQFKDDVVVGAQSLGLTQHVGVLRGLIQSRIKLGQWKKKLMQDPTRIMEAYLGSTQAIGYNAGVI